MAKENASGSLLPLKSADGKKDRSTFSKKEVAHLLDVLAGMKNITDLREAIAHEKATSLVIKKRGRGPATYDPTALQKTVNGFKAPSGWSFAKYAGVITGLYNAAHVDDTLSPAAFAQIVRDGEIKSPLQPPAKDSTKAIAIAS